MSTPTLPPPSAPPPRAPSGPAGPPSGATPLAPPALPQRRSAAAWVLVGVGGVLAAALVAVGAQSVASAAVRHAEPGSAELTGVSSVAVELVRCGGEVEVTGDAPSGTATATWSDRWSFSRPQHVRSVQDGLLTVRVTCSRLTWGWSPETDLDLSVPEGAEVSVRTSAGDVRAVGVGDAQLSSGVGDVVVRGARGELDLITGAGSVVATGVDSPRIAASTGTVDVTLVTTTPPQSVSASSGVGDVLVEVPDDATGYALEVETGVGSAHREVTENDSSGRLVMAMSGVGDVTVRPAG